MSIRLWRDRAGNAAIEFAFVGPILVALAVGGLQVALLLWERNLSHSVATATARCVALRSRECAVPAQGCASGDAGVCYAVEQARRLGMEDLPVAGIAVERAVSIEGVSFTVVTVASEVKLFAVPIPISTKASFPNP